MDFSKMEPMRFRMTADPDSVGEWFATATPEQRQEVISRHLRALPVTTLVQRWKAVVSQLNADELDILTSEWGESRKVQYAALQS